MIGVLVSIRPMWCEKIFSGEKTIEVRKSRPKLETPFRCYVYCSKPTYRHDDFLCINAGTEKARAFYGGGKVIGEFLCDRIDTLSARGIISEEYLRDTCLTVEQYKAYRYGGACYFWHISKIKLYDEPKPLTSFNKPCPESLYCESCAMHNEHPVPFCGNYALQINRPPQSWMYAEDQT